MIWDEDKTSTEILIETFHEISLFAVVVNGNAQPSAKARGI